MQNLPLLSVKISPRKNLYSTWWLLIVPLCLLLLAACNGGSSDDDTDSDTQNVSQAQVVPPIYNIRPDLLVAESGNWILLPDSIDLQEREAGLILTADYEHRHSPAIGHLNMTVYKDSAEAERVLNERVAEWESNASNAVKEITAFADGAYTLNETQAGIVRKYVDGISIVEFEGEIQHTDLDLLNLMQIGVDVLTVREAPQISGSMGSATLAPPPEN